MLRKKKSKPRKRRRKMVIKKETPFELNKYEIKYNIINSLLAGGLVILGSLTAGFSWNGVCAGVVAGLVVAVAKFKDYWKTQEGEYKTERRKTLGLFVFV